MTEKTSDLRYLLVCYSWTKETECGYGNVEIPVQKGKFDRIFLRGIVEELKKQAGFKKVIILSIIDLDVKGNEE